MNDENPSAVATSPAIRLSIADFLQILLPNGRVVAMSAIFAVELYDACLEVARKQTEEADRVKKEIAVVRQAIESHLGVWHHGTPTDTGRIDCPVCGAHKGLSFMRSGKTGAVAARCRHDRCVAWQDD